MTKDIREVIRLLGITRHKIERIEKSSNETVSDRVSGSSSEFPYNKRPITVTGLQQFDRSLYDKLIDREEELEDQLWDCIEELPDSMTRCVIMMRYCFKESFPQIAKTMEKSESYIRYHVHDKLLKEDKAEIG